MARIPLSLARAAWPPGKSIGGGNFYTGLAHFVLEILWGLVKWERGWASLKQAGRRVGVSCRQIRKCTAGYTVGLQGAEGICEKL